MACIEPHHLDITYVTTYNYHNFSKLAFLPPGFDEENGNNCHEVVHTQH